MLWVLFNKNGQYIGESNVGSLPFAGTDTFQIFAVFKDINLSNYGSALIKLYKPDLSNTGLNSLPMDILRDAQEIEYNGTTNSYFTNGQKYQGVYFDFSQYGDDGMEILDTIGNWRAVITLISVRVTSRRNVVGSVTFSVGNGNESEDSYEPSTEEIISRAVGKIGTKLDISSSNYIKAVPTKSGWGFSDAYNISDIIYAKDTKGYYYVNSNYELQELDLNVTGGLAINGFNFEDTEIRLLSNDVWQVVKFDSENFGLVFCYLSNNVYYITILGNNKYINYYTANSHEKLTNIFNKTNVGGVYNDYGSYVTTYDFIVEIDVSNGRTSGSVTEFADVVKLSNYKNVVVELKNGTESDYCFRASDESADYAIFSSQPSITTDAPTGAKILTIMYFKFYYATNSWETEKEDTVFYSKNIADHTFVPVVTSSASRDRAYIVTKTGDQSVRDISDVTDASAIVQRDANGNVIVPEEIGNNNRYATSKKYVDDKTTALTYNETMDILQGEGE